MKPLFPNESRVNLISSAVSSNNGSPQGNKMPELVKSSMVKTKANAGSSSHYVLGKFAFSVPQTFINASKQRRVMTFRRVPCLRRVHFDIRDEIAPRSRSTCCICGHLSRVSFIGPHRRQFHIKSDVHGNFAYPANARAIRVIDFNQISPLISEEIKLIVKSTRKFFVLQLTRMWE